MLSLSLLVTLTIPCLASEQKVVTLNDGSMIHGRIVALEDGSYTVETPSMGTLQIADSDISSITAPGALKAQEAESPREAPAAAPITGTPEFKMIQAQVMSNPDMIGDIQQLMEDPEVMAVISDPSLIKTLQSGDAATLEADPRLRRLSENPRVQALMQKIQSQQ